jgi:hypothetical protein
MTFEELSRLVRREEATKQRLIARTSRLVNLYAFDVLEEMSAKDLAKRVLAKLGIKQDSDDPVAELETYLEGREAGNRARGDVRESGMDSADGGSLVDDYINGR